MAKTGRKEQRLRVGDRELPCRVTMGAMVRYKRATGRDVGSLDTGDVEGLVTFMWCCVASACAADRTEFGMTVEELADHLEPAAIEAFYEGMAAGAAEGVKRKAGIAPG